MDAQPEVTELLRSIDSHLSILTAEVRRAASTAFSSEVLRTDPRRAMFRLMDGARTAADIARETGTTGQAVRDLVKYLEEKGFVSVRLAGNAQVPIPRRDAVITWFLARAEG